MKEQPELVNNIIIIRAELQDPECCTGCPCLHYDSEMDLYECNLFMGQYGPAEVMQDVTGDTIRLKECKTHFLKHKEAQYPPPPPAWIVAQIKTLKKAIDETEAEE